MEKLSIREASERFGLSRARLYQLLEKGAIVGHRSTMRGRSAKSWVDGNSLSVHIENRLEKQRQGGRQGGRHPVGRSPTKADGMYVPITEACNVSGYSAVHIYRLLKQGSIVSKKGSAVLVYLPDLLKYKKK
jgi:predicted DNA-binding transcriptional regulator AlpA